MYTKILRSLILVLLTSTLASAGTITVPGDYSTIQNAIDVSTNGDTVLVSAGVYTESIDFSGKLIVVKSADGPLVTTITNSNDSNLVVFTNGETSGAVLEGFLLLGGRIGVLCENASPTIKYNILNGQTISNWGAISLGGDGYATIGNSPAVIINNTITNCNNGGISTFSSAPPIIKNNIIAFNGHYGIHREGILGTVAQPILSYNDVYGNAVAYQEIANPGVGTIDANPLFFNGFYLMLSSPCIDAGDPDPSYNDPDGSRNDMGAVPYDESVSIEPGVLYVPSEYPTIQAAMIAASHDDTIMVAPGTYEEFINFYTKQVNLISENGAEVTKITIPAASASSHYPEVDTDTLMNYELSSIDTLNDSKYQVAMSASQETTTNALLEIFGSQTALIISGFTFDGQGVVRGIYGQNVDPVISECVFENCVGSYDGGAIFMEHGAPTITNNVFKGNTTPISGGAVFIRLGTGYGVAEVSHNIMYGNVSGNGPAVSLIEGDDAIVSFNVAFDNIATEGSQRRGAIYIRGENIQVVNNTVNGNTVGISVLDTKSSDVRNNIIVNNIIAGFEMVLDYGLNENLTYGYNDVWNNGLDYLDLSADPTDISFDPELDPLQQLSVTSPCIDAGDPNPIYNDPDASRNDIGAHPYSGATSPVINLVQWSASEGGNDHWYAIIPEVKPWINHKQLAESFIYAGNRGHLATVTSIEENLFIHDSLLVGNTGQPSVADEFYLGGFLYGTWEWINNEQFDYTNWAPGEPNGSENALAIWGASTANPGFWNNVPHDTTGLGDIHQLWSIVEFGEFEIYSPDTLNHLVQWTEASGGNGNWYGVIPLVLPWYIQNDIAQSLSFNGYNGYLATVTSAAENQFLVDSILNKVTGQGVADEFYLGGTTTSGWETGESFMYTNWASGEPNGDGIAIAMWGASYPTLGEWNDVPHDGPLGSIHQLYALVEFGPYNLNIIYDSLVLPSVVGQTTNNLQSVICRNSQPIHGATIPLEIPPEVEVTDVILGDAVANWDFNIIQIKPDSNLIFVVLANSFGDFLPEGQTELFSIDYNFVTSSDCDETISIKWDTTLYDDVSRRLTYVDTSSLPIYPGFDVNRDNVTMPQLVPGDFNNDGFVDVGDIVSMVEYMFNGGPPPGNINAADMNGDCIGPDIADLVYIVNFSFSGGPAIPCGCIAKVGQDIDEDDILIETIRNNGKTILKISSPIDLQGIELYLSSQSNSEVTKLVTSEIEMLQYKTNSMTKVGLVDLDGVAYLEKGTHTILAFDTDIRIQEAVVSDRNGVSFRPSISNSNASLIPDQYTLEQNYPNPFNPSTTIEFALPEAAHVELSVYNINGQKISELAHGQYEAGVHSINWDGNDYSSGVYFYILETEQYSKSRKMLLIK